MLEFLLLSYLFSGFWMAGNFCGELRDKGLDKLQVLLYTVFWVLLWLPSAIVVLWIYWKGKRKNE